jgi:acyl carrier protein
MREKMKEEILEILEGALPQIDFATSDALVDDGILDSLSIVTLVSELSMEYDIIFDLNELTPENLNSLDAIVDTVIKMQK